VQPTRAPPPRGYVPPSALRGRVDWLVAQYLLAEDIAAAEELMAFAREHVAAGE
jgi:hypothetical protein